MLQGFSRYRTYYKDGIDRLEIDWNIFRVGSYKTAVEPYLRNDMSDEAKEANLGYLDDLWQSYLEDVAAARSLQPAAIVDYIEGINDHLAAAGGQPAVAALDAGLVDHLGGRDQVRERMIELVGEDEDIDSFYRIGLDDYLEATEDQRQSANKGDEAVGVVVAVGTILDGSHAPGKIGGDSTAALVRQARENDEIKAIVLRVDSGGGSAFASEIIRRELELTRQAGKPVVVSMGGVAASGGYWISLASDEIWASPNTITGSIGIYGMIPTFQKPLAKYLGVRVDGVGTTSWAGAVRPDRQLPPEIGRAVQQMIDHGYQDFITRVAEARGMTPEEVDAIAQGRVWSGEDGLDIGLVDKLGGLDEAIAAAADKAGLEDGYRVDFVEKELELKDRIVRDLLARAAATFGPGAVPVTVEPPLARVVRSLQAKAQTLLELNDPYGMYALCLDVAEPL
jgi:protease-4